MYKKILTCVLIAIVLTSTFSAQAIAIPLRKDVPVLMYHELTNDPALINDYAITPQMFEQDIITLTQNGYTPITPTDLYAMRYNTAWDDTAAARVQQMQIGAFKPVLLTFDDSFRSDYLYALPILQKYQVPATFFVFTAAIRDAEYDGRRYLLWDELREMAQSPYVCIGSHGHHLHDQSADTLRMLYSTYDGAQTFAADAAQNFALIREKLGVTVSAFAYPYGVSSFYTEEILIANGIALTFQTVGPTWNLSMNTRLISRINRGPNIVLGNYIALPGVAGGYNINRRHILRQRGMIWQYVTIMSQL